MIEQIKNNEEKPLRINSIEAGGALLPVIAAAALVMVMTQGAVFYKAKASTQFLTQERNKVMASQAAEAGVENTIADIGSRRLVVLPTMHQYVAAQDKQVGTGQFTTMLTTLAMGSNGDTVDLSSVGTVNQTGKTVNAKLRLHNVIDSTPAITATLSTWNDTTFGSHIAYLIDTTIQDPNAMPALDATPAYTACMSSAAKKCDICHLPGGDYTKANVINVAKAAINTHITHHGDYVTTDGTCDIYNPQITSTPYNVPDTTIVAMSKVVYDTTIALDTLVKVEILSWK